MRSWRKDIRERQSDVSEELSHNTHIPIEYLFLGVDSEVARHFW